MYHRAELATPSDSQPDLGAKCTGSIFQHC